MGIAVSNIAVQQATTRGCRSLALTKYATAGVVRKMLIPHGDGRRYGKVNTGFSAGLAALNVEFGSGIARKKKYMFLGRCARLKRPTARAWSSTPVPPSTDAPYPVSKKLWKRM